MNQWIKWITDLHAISQNGLTFSKDPYDIERYNKLRMIANEMLSQISTAPSETINNLVTKNIGYATPKVDVRVAIFKDDQILLVRERTDGRWSLPGGWADINDSPSEMAIREVYEETGYIVSVKKLVAVYDKHKHAHPVGIPHAYKLFFLCELEGGAPAESIEIIEIGFFSKNNLPELSTTRVVESQILKMYEHRDNLSLPTEFD